MTIELYKENSYIKECKAQIVSVDERFVVFEQTIFYPGGGGQPCDQGTEQACGGTHVNNTSEIGDFSIVKIQNKGASKRRIKIQLH